MTYPKIVSAPDVIAEEPTSSSYGMVVRVVPAAVAPVSPVVSPTAQKRVDLTSVSSTYFIGYADAGAAASAPAWTIQRTLLDVDGNPTLVQWSAPGAVWNDRITVVYS